MARKYRRLLYHNRILFFDKCSIDPEARPIVLKYRAEYDVHAYELAERCKELLLEQESYKSTALFRATSYTIITALISKRYLSGVSWNSTVPKMFMMLFLL
jgi:hypothetical protein